MGKRRIAVLSASIVAMAGMLLSGCSSSPAAPLTPTKTADASGDITFWSAIGGMDKVTQQFNQSQSKIHVTFETIPNGGGGGYAKLNTAIQAGTGPDVAGIEYPQLPEFVSAGQLIPLNGLVPQSTIDKYSAQIRGMVTFNGKVYGMPYDAAPMVMYYRQDLLKAAGVAVPKTWSQFEEAGKKLKAVNPNAYLASFYPNETGILAGLSWANGAHWFSTSGDSWKVNFTDKQSTQVADFWTKMISEGIVKVETSFSDQWAADLADGTLAGAVSASWGAPGIQSRTEGAGQQGKWIAAQIPTFTGSPASAFYGGTSWVVTKNSKHQAAAAVFAKYLATNPAAITARGNAGSAFLAYPGLTDVAQKAYDSSYFGNDIYSVFKAAYKTIKPDWEWGPNWDVTNTALQNDLADVSQANPDLTGPIASAQKETVKQLKSTGLSVK